MELYTQFLSFETRKTHFKSHVDASSVVLHFVIDDQARVEEFDEALTKAIRFGLGDRVLFKGHLALVHANLSRHEVSHC